MAARKPIVLVNGVPAEMPAGDTWASPAFSGTFTFTSGSGQDIALSSGIISSGGPYVITKSTSGFRIEDAGGVSKGFIFFDATALYMLRSDGGTIWSSPLGTSRVEFANTMRLASFTVADLPSATTAGNGAQVFATNGRKVGEGVGAGTGVPVYASGGTWFRFADDTAVAA